MAFWSSLFSLHPRPGASSKTWDCFFSSLSDDQLLDLGEEGISRLMEEDYQVAEARSARRGKVFFGKVGFSRVERRLHDLIWRRRYEQAKHFLETASSSELSSLSAERAEWLIGSCSSPRDGEATLTAELHRRRCGAIAEREHAVIADVLKHVEGKLENVLRDAMKCKDELCAAVSSRSGPRRSFLREQLQQINDAIDQARSTALPTEVVASEVEALQARREQLRRDDGALDRVTSTLERGYAAALDSIRKDSRRSLAKKERSAEAAVISTATQLAGYCPYNVGKELHQRLFPLDKEANRRLEYTESFTPVVEQATNSCEELDKKMREQWLGDSSEGEQLH